LRPAFYRTQRNSQENFRPGSALMSKQIVLRTVDRRSTGVDTPQAPVERFNVERFKIARFKVHLRTERGIIEA
jgi:hypothetical protein